MTASEQMLGPPPDPFVAVGDDGGELGESRGAEGLPRLLRGRPGSDTVGHHIPEALIETLPARSAKSATEYGNQQVVDGRLRLIRRLGSGGMGEVWEAEQLDPRCIVAVKLLADKYSGDDAMKRRFLREARICSGIRHKNIVKVFDVGTTEAGIPYYVMELLHGVPLSDLIAAAEDLDVDRALSILFQIACALEEAHAVKIIHRDLKPENVIAVVEPDDGDGPSILCKLIDFGLAKQVDLDPSASKLTQSGAVFGTPAYMSPEQIEGHATDERADVYSFGCLAYEVVTGSPPFKGDNLANLFFQHLFTACPSILDAVAPRHRGDSRLVALDGLIRWTLHKEPAKRPASMADVADTINSITMGADVQTPDPSTHGIEEQQRPEERRPRTRRPLVAGVTGAVVVGSFVAYWAMSPTRSVHGGSESAPSETLQEARATEEDAAPRVTIVLGNDGLPCVPRAFAKDRPVGSFEEGSLVLDHMELPSDVVIRCTGFEDYRVLVDTAGVQAPVVLLPERAIPKVEAPSLGSPEEAPQQAPPPKQEGPAAAEDDERPSKGRKPAKGSAPTKKRPRDTDVQPSPQPEPVSAPAPKQKPPPLLSPDAPPKVPPKEGENESKRAPFRTE